MIVKITRGADMYGAVRYLATDKAEVARENPHIVTGLGRDGEALEASTVADVARELDAPRLLFETQIKNGHVWACSLSLNHDADGRLGDEQWRAIAEDFMRRMNFGDVRWIAVQHGPNAGGHDHVHIVASMVCQDGSKAREWGDYVRASKAANAIEHEHGLSVVEGRELGTGARGYNAAEAGAAERLHGQGTEPARDYLERVVRACSVQAHGEREFVRLVRAEGVKVKPRMAAGSSEVVVGYSYALPGSASYGGGRLARDLTLPRLRERWASPVPQTADQAAHRAAGRLAARSLRLERQPGPLARESRELGRFAQTRAGAGPLLLSMAAAQALRARVRAAEREAQRAREQEHDQRAPRHERHHDNEIGL